MSEYKTYEVRVYADGSKQWYLNDKLHREDGMGGLSQRCDE